MNNLIIYFGCAFIVFMMVLAAYLYRVRTFMMNQDRAIKQSESNIRDLNRQLINKNSSTSVVNLADNINVPKTLFVEVNNKISSINQNFLTSFDESTLSPGHLFDYLDFEEFISLASLGLTSGLKRFNYSIICSEEDNFFYCETPKVGCSSIKYALLKKYYPEKLETKSIHKTANETFSSPQKMGFKRFHDWLRIDKPDGFAFFRNPQDRIISSYKEKIIGTDPVIQSYPKYQAIRDTIFSNSQHIDINDGLQKFIDIVIKEKTNLMDVHWMDQRVVTYYDFLPFSSCYQLENGGLDLGMKKILSKGKQGLPEWFNENKKIIINQKNNDKLHLSIDTQAKIQRRFKHDFDIWRQFKIDN